MKKANQILKRKDKNGNYYYYDKKNKKRVSKMIYDFQFKIENKKKVRVNNEDFLRNLEFFNKNKKDILKEFKKDENIGLKISSVNLKTENVNKKRNEALKELRENKENYSVDYWELPSKLNAIDDSFNIYIKTFSGMKEYEKNEALIILRHFVSEVNNINYNLDLKKKKKSKIYILIPFYEDYVNNQVIIDFTNFTNISNLSDNKIIGLIDDLI